MGNALFFTRGSLRSEIRTTTILLFKREKVINFKFPVVIVARVSEKYANAVATLETQVGGVINDHKQKINDKEEESRKERWDQNWKT